MGELLDLHVSQVDLPSRLIHLDGDQTKNGTGRKAPIEDRLYPWLEAAMMGKDGDCYVFSRDSDRLRPIADFRVIWHKVCVVAGLGKMLCRTCGAPVIDGKCPRCNRELTIKEQRYKGLIFHDLRRSGVRNLVRAGVPESVCMAISGHKTRSVFLRYDVVSESDLHAAAAKMNQRQLTVSERKSSTDIPTDSCTNLRQSEKLAQKVLPS